MATTERKNTDSSFKIYDDFRERMNAESTNKQLFAIQHGPRGEIIARIAFIQSWTDIHKTDIRVECFVHVTGTLMVKGVALEDDATAEIYTRAFVSAVEQFKPPVYSVLGEPGKHVANFFAAHNFAFKHTWAGALMLLDSEYSVKNLS